MTIAELFVKIGVKGADNAGKALGGVKKAIQDIADVSLEAKAALVAVVYGMEQMMTQSARRGMELQKFADLTGLSTDRLQKWQYAARQSGVDGDNMRSSIVGVQTAMADMLTGKGAPAGMGIFAKATGFDPAKARDTFYVMDKLREFAKQAPPDIGNSVLRSFGLSDDVIQFIRTSKIELDKIKPSNVYSSSEIERLSKIHVAWENLWNTLKYFMGHHVANFGMPIVRELSEAVTLVMKLTSAVEILTKRFPILGDVGKVALVALGAALLVMGGPLTALATAVTGIIFLLGELNKDLEGKETALDKPIFEGPQKWVHEKLKGILPEAPKELKDAYHESRGGVREAFKTGKLPSEKKEENKPFLTMMKEMIWPAAAAAEKKKKGEQPVQTVLTGISPEAASDEKSSAIPTKIGALPAASAIPSGAKGGSNSTSNVQNINVKQDLNFQHDGKDAKKTGDSTKKAIENTFRQLSTQGQGT